MEMGTDHEGIKLPLDEYDQTTESDREVRSGVLRRQHLLRHDHEQQQDIPETPDGTRHSRRVLLTAGLGEALEMRR